MKTYIRCSYEKKEIAKKLGCRWDSLEKKWYYPSNELTEEILQHFDKFEPTYKERFGHCEDAPCCGCC